MFIVTIDARCGAHEADTSTGVHRQAWRAFKRAVAMAPPLTASKYPNPDTFVCRLYEDGSLTITAFGATRQEAADVAHAMHKKTVRGGGR